MLAAIDRHIQPGKLNCRQINILNDIHLCEVDDTLKKSITGHGQKQAWKSNVLPCLLFCRAQRDNLHLFLKVGGHIPFYGATDTPVLDFWWHFLWVSKPEWASLFALGGGIHTWHTFPEIHLWCDTCRTLDVQHGSRSFSPHTIFKRLMIYR